MTANPFDRGGLSSVAVPQADDPYSISTPVGLSDYKITDFVGELLMVEPVEYTESITTSNGTTDVFRANLIPLTGAHAGEQINGVMVWQVALKRELMEVYRSSNRWLLARLTVGEAQSGKNAPYLFADPSQDDLALQRKFAASKR